MQDSFDTPAPSTLKPILYGVVLGVGGVGLFLAAYVIAPDLGFAGTLAIAAGLAVIVMILLNAVLARASGEIAALARGEDVPSTDIAGHALPRSAAELRLEEWEGRVTQLRQQTDAIDRATQRTEWLESARALADELKGLATEEMSIPGRKHQQSSLGRFRQAVSIYRRLTTARGAVRDRDWGVAQIALGECLLVLGEAEGARDEVMEAANAFAAGLEIADLSPEERRAGDNALAQTEGVLASMAEARNAGDDLL